MQGYFDEQNIRITRSKSRSFGIAMETRAIPKQSTPKNVRKPAQLRQPTKSKRANSAKYLDTIDEV